VQTVKSLSIRPLEGPTVAAFSPIAFLYDERGEEVFELALALCVFTLVAMVGLEVIPKAAVAQVTTDDTNFSQALANGY
jgi:hypothetical protein